MSGNNGTGQYAPASTDDELVLRWLLRARESQSSHYERGVYFDRWNFWFGIPVIAVTAVVSASVFISFEKTASVEVKYWTMALSLIAVVLSSLQAFLKFSELAEKHRAAGAEYGSLRRRLEIMHVSSPKEKAAIEKIGADISALSTRAPAISQSFFSGLRRGV